MTEKRNNIPIGLRIPRDQADWLKKEAQASHRSVSNYAAWALEQYRKQQEAAGAPAT